ncbi:hypothetical protein H7J07_18045 [Mycobacterium koreense]|uniref:Uncharacterized protein n=2 Tax=Mycolicibacillus koreensis TaxID=1069220 RepID=A0AA91PCG8_9MYCO|nr:hypothetical protein [Mycolicibacillus koreensis]OSC26256.1 hypothetical protein B8W67_18610 [Mycolicibacillus koreensis]
MAMPAPADATQSLTYEVISSDIGRVDVEYVDRHGRELLIGVSLPWRLDLPLGDGSDPLIPHAQLRADWRTIAAPSRWVTVKISHAGGLLCQSTLDVGNVTCYGNTPHVS